MNNIILNSMVRSYLKSILGFDLKKEIITFLIKAHT